MTETKIKPDLSEVEFLEYVEAQSKAEFPCFSTEDTTRFTKIARGVGQTVSPRTTHRNSDGALVEEVHLRFLRYQDIHQVLAAIWTSKIPTKGTA